MSNIAQFSQDAINSAVAEFIPAEIRVTGKTSTEKRLSIITVAEDSVQLFAASMKGKVGNAARDGIAGQGLRAMTMQAARGNYRPLAQCLALIQGENVYMTSRAAYESYGDVLGAKMDQLADADKKYTKGGDKFSAKYAALAQCLALYSGIKDGVAAIYAQRDEDAATE